MSDAEEPLAARARGLFGGAVIGVCTAFGSVLCGVFVAFLLNVALTPAFFEGPGSDEPGRMSQATFDVLSLCVVLAVALIVSALLGRAIVGRWRGALSGAGALAFALITVLGVALSPLPQSEWATGLAAIASSAIWGAAFLRPTRDIPVD